MSPGSSKTEACDPVQELQVKPLLEQELKAGFRATIAKYLRAMLQKMRVEDLAPSKFTKNEMK
jgi:hypothetical protein